MDKSTTVADLRDQVADFVARREWETFHNPKNLAISISIEAAELQEHFQWRSISESQEYLEAAQARLEVADELADVMIYCLSFANASGIDISRAIRSKLARNEGRFPPATKTNA
jgi:NTP pyrophosphatase (non-canonical NTP hydrolase)